MKVPLSLLGLCLVVSSSQGEPPAPPAAPGGPPRVCLASIDDKAIVRLRYYITFPRVQSMVKYIEEVEGKKVEKVATIEHRHSSEQILTVPVEAFEVFLDGKLIDAKLLKDLLPKEAPVLVTGQKLQAGLLKAVKKGTLILVTAVPLDENRDVVPMPGPPAVQ